jgi:hypothetical protein
MVSSAACDNGSARLNYATQNTQRLRGPAARALVSNATQAHGAEAVPIFVNLVQRNCNNYCRGR